MPNSLTSVVPDRPRLSLPEHLCRILVRTSCSSFHGPQIDSSFPIPPFVRFLPLRLPRTWTVRPGDGPARATPRRRLSLHDGTRILTRFPFDPLELRRDLGPANPRLISIAEEPLLFSVVGVLTRLTLLLWPGFSSPFGPLEFSPELPPEQSANLLDHAVTRAVRSRW